MFFWYREIVFLQNIVGNIVDFKRKLYLFNIKSRMEAFFIKQYYVGRLLHVNKINMIRGKYQVQIKRIFI